MAAPDLADSFMGSLQFTTGERRPGLAVGSCEPRHRAGLGLVAAALALGAGALPARAETTGPAVLTQITPGADRDRTGLLLSFDRLAPPYSVLGNGSDQPTISFVGATRAPGTEAPRDLKAVASAVTADEGGGILTLHMKEPGPTSVAVTPVGDRAVFVALKLVSGAPAPAAAPASSAAPVSTGDYEEAFEVVPLKFADVSEIVGLLTADQSVKPNDTFTPQEPAFGSAGMNAPGALAVPQMNLGLSSGADAGAQALGQTIDEAVGIDRRLNAIILKGPPERIAALKAKIAKLDRPVTSVILETVFVELTESGARNVGLDPNNANAQIATVSYTSGYPTPTGGATSLTTATLQAAIYAQVQEGRGRIISKPRISAQSGSSAKIITGDALPILTSIALSGVNAVAQQVQYVTVGVTLQIAPRISSDGFVSSRIFCVISNVTGYAQGYPTISQREASTSATVHDGESFVIGGLTQETALSTNSKVPGISGVPLIGALFKLQKATKAKTDLYIVVTPHIVRDEDAALAARRLADPDSIVSVSPPPLRRP